MCLHCQSTTRVQLVLGMLGAASDQFTCCKRPVHLSVQTRRMRVQLHWSATGLLWHDSLVTPSAAGTLLPVSQPNIFTTHQYCRDTGNSTFCFYYRAAMARQPGDAFCRWRLTASLARLFRQPKAPRPRVSLSHDTVYVLEYMELGRSCSIWPRRRPPGRPTLNIRTLRESLSAVFWEVQLWVFTAAPGDTYGIR